MKPEIRRTKAFAMSLTNPAFPPGSYRFVNREYFIIRYRTDNDVCDAPFGDWQKYLKEEAIGARVEARMDAFNCECASVRSITP
jgi:hypothetical protein